VDEDTRLLETTGNVIKSHLARFDMPLLGALSFGESDSESGDEDDEGLMDCEDDDCNGEADEVEEEDGGEIEEEEVGKVEVRVCGVDVGKQKLASVSKDAELGTTVKGSRKGSHSLFS